MDTHVFGHDEKGYAPMMTMSRIDSTVRSAAHNTHTIVLFIVRGIVCAMMISVSALLPLSLVNGSLPVTVHAASTRASQASLDRHVRAQTPCVADPTPQHCNAQDPVVQACNTDAQTIAYAELIQKGVLQATIERRYSATCHSEWGRIIAVPNNHQPIVVAIGAIGVLQSQQKSDHLAFSPMMFIPNLSVAPEIRGEMSTDGIPIGQFGSRSVAFFLPAFPVAQK